MKKIPKTKADMYRLATRHLRDFSQEPLCQKGMSIELKKSKSTISEHINWLVKNEYLKPIDKDKIIFYEPGKKGFLVEKAIEKTRTNQLMGDMPDGVKKPELDVKTRTIKPELTEPPHIQYHSHGVRAIVKTKPFEHKVILIDNKEIEVFREYRPRMWSGKVEVNGKEYSLRFLDKEDEVKCMDLWIEGLMSPQEMESFESKGELPISIANQVQDVYNHLAKYGGWEFSLFKPLEYKKGKSVLNSESHFVPRSDIVEAMRDIMPPNTDLEVETSLGKLHTDKTPDDGTGRRVMETTAMALAAAMAKDLADIHSDNKTILKIMEVMEANNTLVQIELGALREILDRLTKLENIGEAIRVERESKKQKTESEIEESEERQELDPEAMYA